MISERDDGENHNVFIEFCFEFCYLQPLTKMVMSHCKIDRITTAKNAEEEGDEEYKKRMDLNVKVTLELTARSIIASCGLRIACTGTRLVDWKP